jgi:hypothetical protein
MAIYHLEVKIISRGSGKSAVEAAAFQSNEKLVNSYNGLTHDYSKLHDVEYTEIMLPDGAKPELSDRETLWNAVEAAEKQKNSQLAREVEIALPIELDRSERIQLVREYVKQNFVDAGMCADIAVHVSADENADPEAVKRDNPHAHIMLTMRPINLDGDRPFGDKAKKVYVLDQDGNRIKLKSGRWKSRKLNTTNWDSKDSLLRWRASWAEMCNAALENKGVAARIDQRSYKDQGLERIPTIHLGAAARLEAHGIRTKRGDINRQIRRDNEAMADKNNHIGVSRGTIIELETERVKKAQPEAVSSAKIQSEYTQIDNTLNKHMQEAAKRQQDIRTLISKADLIEKNANTVLLKQAAYTTAVMKKKSMGLLQLHDKRELKMQIMELEQEYRQAEADFKSKYEIEPSQAAETVATLRQQAASLQKQSEEIKRIQAPKDQRLLEAKMELAHEYNRIKQSV